MRVCVCVYTLDIYMYIYIRHTDYICLKSLRIKFMTLS